jgi:hypothetical protein
MSGGGSFSSDQGNAHATATAQLVATGRRARVTSIQGEGIASALLVFRSGGATGDVIATYGFGTEGLDLYIPGSGILFEEGVHVTVTNCPNVSITFT